MDEAGYHLGVLVRYCDDLVIMCRSERGAREARRQLDAIVERLGLHLNPQKTCSLQPSQASRGRTGRGKSLTAA